jgi:hypothetical protein
VKYLALVVVSGCGRLAFDPTADAAASDGATQDASLVMHFTFEPASFLDELARGADATCASCPSMTTGVAGTAASFDGVADCLRVPVVGIAPPAFTYAIWERTAERRRATIIGRPLDGATSFGNAFEIYMRDTMATDLELIAASTTVSFPHEISDWHHIAGVFDGSTFTTYYDGLVQNMASSLPPQVWTNDAIQIGCDIDSGVELSYFNGDVDDARLYSRALSGAEIVALATE